MVQFFFSSVTLGLDRSDSFTRRKMPKKLFQFELFARWFRKGELTYNMQANSGSALVLLGLCLGMLTFGSGQSSSWSLETETE